MVRTLEELRVYQAAMSTAMEIFFLTKRFPEEERYSLTSQIRRSSRSVCANLGEAWRKRRYPAAFTAKLSDAETEAGETQVWIEMAHRCRYIDRPLADDLKTKYDHILAQLVKMIDAPYSWIIKN